MTIGCGVNQLEGTFNKKELGVLMASKLDMSQKHSHEAKKAISFLGCNKQNAEQEW